ncbi:MAG: hypothetical protein E3J37_01845 [Anaerolineales bacterium]|nr:MAG: hypothetical protein E3J37_01845 [Anaerolineales bacterium]
MECRVQADPEKVKLRKTLAEHPLGTIKRYWNHRYFLMKGLENVGAETSLSVLAYRSSSRSSREQSEIVHQVVHPARLGLT